MRPQTFRHDHGGKNLIALQRGNEGLVEPEQKPRNLPGGLLHGERIAYPHLLIVFQKLLPGGGLSVFGNTEKKCKQFGFLIIALLFLIRQFANNQLIHGHRGFPQRGMHPQHGVGFIGLVGAAFTEGSGILLYFTMNTGMNLMYPQRAVDNLIQTAVYHFEHIGKGTAKPAQGIIHGARMLFDGIGHPGMCILQ